MDIYGSFVSVSLCGTAHQREIGTRGLRLIVGGGEVEVLEGFWQLDPLEVNVKVLTWTNDLESLIVKIARFCEAYQRYASQESVFVTYKHEDRHEAIVVYAGEWDQLVERVDHGLFLANWFQRNASFQAQCDRYDGRDEYPAH